MRVLIAAAVLAFGLGAAPAMAEDVSHCLAGQKAAKTDPAAARTEFKLCVSKGALTPEHASAAHVSLAMLAMELKKFPEVISEFDLAQKAAAPTGKKLQMNAGMYYARGVANAEMGKMQNARADLDAARKLSPNEMPIVIPHMGVLMALKDFDGALADANTLVAQTDTKWKVLGQARKMQIYEAKRDLPSAYAASQEVLKLDPDNIEIRVARVNLLDAMGKRDEVLTDTDKMLTSKNPEVQFTARTIRGSIYDEEKKFDAALKEADAAIALNAKNPVGYNNRCMALANLGRGDDAIASCQKAMTIAPKATMVWNSLGYAYEKAGKLTDAVTYYQKVAAVEPKNKRNLDDLARAKAALIAQGGTVPAAPVATAAAKPATPPLVKPSTTTTATASAKPAPAPGQIVVTPSGATFTDEKKPAKKKP